MNRNWRLETAAGTYAVKEITDVFPPEVRRNLAVLSGLANDGIPVPAPLAADGGELVVKIGGHGYCVVPRCGPRVPRECGPQGAVSHRVPAIHRWMAALVVSSSAETASMA
ncbi:MULTISPECIES: phosphotransferase [unclassified Streptomyces]|uniref:phosphotransferase n=1 Tax=unclassified Streptomyces TaxID=2593676 RepID=UPI001BECE9B3|nr:MULTISPECIES: phosphotransferase [unclassified Streptomyces]MBT2405334.1 phosphotransferase [Streptomyces sp. ISL-21]MBT2454301.1 phosphotransferase [Streptomyces sp. ISL-86]MBT2613807.1 phosphotransferase [Streptomyces sp. ISL-87]